MSWQHQTTVQSNEQPYTRQTHRSLITIQELLGDNLRLNEDTSIWKTIWNTLAASSWPRWGALNADTLYISNAVLTLSRPTCLKPAQCTWSLSLQVSFLKTLRMPWRHTTAETRDPKVTKLSLEGTMGHQGWCDLEKWVMVKWLIWEKGHGKDNHFAYWKVSCFSYKAFKSQANLVSISSV